MLFKKSAAFSWVIEVGIVMGQTKKFVEDGSYELVDIEELKKTVPSQPGGSP